RAALRLWFGGNNAPQLSPPDRHHPAGLPRSLRLLNKSDFARCPSLVRFLRDLSRHAALVRPPAFIRSHIATLAAANWPIFGLAVASGLLTLATLAGFGAGFTEAKPDDGAATAAVLSEPS